MTEIIALALAVATIGWMIYIAKHDSTTWKNS